MRLFIMILLILVLDWYTFQAVRTLATNWPPLLRSAVYALHWMVPVGLAAWIFILTNGSSMVGKNAITLVRTLFFIVYISKILVASMLVIDDFRRVSMMAYNYFSGTVAHNPSRSVFLSQMGFLLGGIPFVSLLYGMIRNPYRYTLFKETVHLDNLPAALDGLRIIQISDIHSGSFMHKEPVRNAVNLINQQKPDLVFFTGDLVNSVATEIEPFFDVFDKIQAKYGVYSVLGNHDYGDYHQWEREEDKEQNLLSLYEAHRKMGWNLLLNQNQMLDIEGEKVAVIGVENYSAHPRFPKYGDLKKACAGTEEAPLKLLLSHDPSHWEEQVIREFSDIAVTFSGHTHGMQFGVEIPGWFKWSPIKYVYRQWAGLYQREKQYLYVNRGLGYLGYPGRVGIMPEVTVLELRSA